MPGNYHILELRVTSSSEEAISFLSSEFDSALENEGFKMRGWTYSYYGDGTTNSLIAVRKSADASANISESLMHVREKTKKGLYWNLLGTYTDSEICDRVYASLLQSQKYSPRAK